MSRSRGRGVFPCRSVLEAGAGAADEGDGVVGEGGEGGRERGRGKGGRAKGGAGGLAEVDKEDALRVDGRAREALGERGAKVVARVGGVERGERGRERGGGRVAHGPDAVLAEPCA